MKTLVVYYSRTGTTKKVAEEIAKNLKADLDEIKDKKNRNGAMGYLYAGRDAVKKRLTEVKFKKNPEKYDLIVIGTPIWGWNMCPAFRTYVKENKKKIKKVAFFCTMGGSGGENALAEAERLIGKKTEKLVLMTKEVVSGNFKEKVKEFCRKIK
jgi:flavodoxin